MSAKPVNAYKYKADQKKREDGILVEVDCSGDYPSARVVKKVGSLLTFLVANATADNPNFEAAHAKHLAEYRKAKESKEKTEDELARMRIEAFDRAFVEACALDWYNQLDEQGNPWPFSKDAAAKFFADVPEVEVPVSLEAQDRRHFRIELPGSIETDAKNS